MRALVQDLIPHAPQFGLFVAPEIPEGKLNNAIRDFGRGVRATEVLALYDATLLGTGRDGALFLADRLVFQNTDLEPAQSIRYDDILEVHLRKRLVGGRKIEITANRGRATLNLVIDFSGKPGAAEYVLRFLSEAMMKQSDELSDEVPNSVTDKTAVRKSLDQLVAQGLLTPDDRDRMLGVI